MSHERSIPVTMKAMAPGNPIAGAGELPCSSSPLPGQMACRRARRMADAILLYVVLLCTLLGDRMVRTDETGLPEERAFFRACPSRDSCGLIPVIAGSAGSGSRAFLQA